MHSFQIRARQPLFFMHIPKTAGMSMRLYLSEQYHPHDISPVLRWRGLLGREHELASYRLVQGHFQYNLRALLAKDTRVLVILRDPLRRTVSALRHLQRDPSFHADHQLAQGLTLAQMIRHPALMRNQHNVQARYLCASMPPDQVAAYFEQQRPHNPNADAGDREQPPTVTLATERLEATDFVGLTEDIGAVVSAMALEMNYHPPLYFPFINENPNRQDPLDGLTDDDLAILRENNDIDLQIYDYARRLIERRTFARDMRQLLRSGVYAVPPGSFEVPLSGIMPGSGWYAPDQNDGLSWRWTGPGRHFTVELPLRPDTSYRLIMRFGSLHPVGPGELTAEVNDLPMPFDLTPEGNSYRAALTIPQDLLGRNAGFCRIRFDTKVTTKLPPPEIRALGISVRQIVFECLDP
jgi:hypothetical protein